MGRRTMTAAYLTVVHAFDDLSPFEQARIRRKRQRMLDEGIYGAPFSEEINRWLGQDRGWLVYERWAAPPDVAEEVASEFMASDGVIYWEEYQDHLAYEVPEAFMVYGDPGDPEDIVWMDLEMAFTPPFPIKPIFKLIEGGRSDHDDT